MHIVFVCAEFPFLNQATGGFGTYVNILSQAMIEEGVKVSIICKSGNSVMRESKERKIYCIKPSAPSFISKLSLLEIKPIKRIASFIEYPFGFSYKVMQALDRINREDPIDIIEGADFGAELFFYLLLRKNRQPKVVIKLHTPSFVIRKYNHERRNLFYAFMENMEKAMLQKADAIYSPTKSLKKIVKQDIGMDSQVIIPNPKPKSNFNPSIKRSSNLILYVGKIQRKKGVFTIIKSVPTVVAKNRNIQFCFIGPDTNENGMSVTRILKNELKRKNLLSHVGFIEPLPNNKLRSYYLKAAVILAPSEWENFPYIVIEAACFGCPIISTKTGGIEELLTDGIDALLIDSGDSNQLSQNINKLLGNTALASQLSKSAYKHITTKLDAKVIAQTTIEFFQKVINS